MFYQNSNDLVKQASAKSGHVHNSYATQQQLINQGPNIDANSVDAPTNDDHSMSKSLSIGSQFQNALNSLIGSFTPSTIEGIDGPPPAPADPVKGPLGGNGDQTSVLSNLVQQNINYVAQEDTYRKRIRDVRNISAEDPNSSRAQWAHVTDVEGISKYGYITKDRIFQVWLAPTDPKNNPQNWFETSPVKQNGGVLGCPATSGSITKYEIDAKWDNIKPFDMIYAKNDGSHKNPLFMLTVEGVRVAKRNRWVNPNGMFSCGNESTNVFVKERPSADFDTSAKTNRQGCYVVDEGVKDSTFKERGFEFQADLANVSISQCKRRAEDLGASYFLISPPESGQPANKGGCWIYTGWGEPNLDGLLTFNTDQTKCHIVETPENDEDGFMKAYSTRILNRMYGKKHIGDLKSYVSKGDGLWPGEGPNEYACSGVKGRNTTGHYGNFNKYCIFDAEEDAKNWCSSDPTCLGYTDINKTYQVVKRHPDVNPHGGKYYQKSTTSKTTMAVALYSLKIDGPNGVDRSDKNGRGFVGRIAYVDHNGERHDYPESALSYIKPGDTADASGTAMRYVDIGPYDTRSAESSYSLREITPGKFSDATNLIYKASRDGWGPDVFHQKCDNKGPTYTRAIINDGRVLGAYSGVSWVSNMAGYRGDPTAFLYDGENKYTPNNGAWGAGTYETYTNMGSYLPTFGGGHDFYINGQYLQNNAFTFLTSNKVAPFGRKMYSNQSYPLSDLEVYTVDSTSFPKTMEYAIRSRTMPVGEVINTSMEKCKEMCDGDDKCGGYVYSKGSGAEGKCELKDKTTMFPVGLRVVDHTKRLMLKVPTVNGTIADPACASAGKGKYNIIDSAQYLYYPDGGEMSSGTKCNIGTVVPKQGNLQMPDITPAVTALSSQSNTTQTKIKEYGAQTSVSGKTETFTVLREGLGIETKTDAEGSTYGNAMAGVSNTLKKIGNAQYQRERLDAIKDESNKLLISKSYKFILWSILAILAIMALLKIKETFGQDDVDEDGGEAAAGGGGILGFITSLFGIGAVKLDDIADKTGDVKSAIANAGATIQQSSEDLAKGITEGADNLMTSANEAANNAVDSARNMADQVSSTATNAVNSIGNAVGVGASNEEGDGVKSGGRRSKSPRRSK